MVIPAYVTEYKGHRVMFYDENYNGWCAVPHVFVEKASNNHQDWDVLMGWITKQKKSAFESWLDGTEMVTTFDYVKEHVLPAWGLKYDSVMNQIDIILREERF